MAIAYRVLPPLSSYSFRRSKVCQHMESCLLSKDLDCFFVSIQKHSFDVKLSYLKPVRTLSLRCASRTTFTSVGPLGIDKDSALNNIQRSKTSFDGSKAADGEDGFERELQELFDEVKMMISMGNKSDAADLLRANYEAVKERVNAGARGMEEAALIDVIALGYMALGDLKLVGSLLGMFSEVVNSLKDDEQLLDSVLVHMGSMYSTLGKFEKSVTIYHRAIDIMEKKYGRESVFLVTPFLGMAKALGSMGKAAKAIELYHRTITILESGRGAQSEDLVIPLFGLGNLLLQEGKAKDAETPFLRILNIYTKVYGECDGRVGMAMCSLAHAQCAMGKADEAIRLYRNALQLVKDSNYMAMDDSTMEKIRIDLAELLHVVGRGKEGRELLEECLLITEKSRGKEHPSSVTHLINLATSHLRSKNYAEAEHLLRTSLQIMAKTVGTDDQSITFPMLHLAVALYHLRRDEEAEQIALEALRIREKAFGKDSLPVAEALDCLVSIQNRLIKDDGVLLEQLKRVLRIQERELGNEREEVLETLKKIAFYLDKLGRKDEKSSLQKRLSMLRMKFKQRIRY
ncbi:N-terminal acetyltransferase A, auxiliary subunit [Trema orientale]|uniref:N-terminal acetyltransferase A, auxiliary subunit n=1 Tax=Trema orientale TaxID=63057 RepID=A0A2P5E6R5_TREOI|nr:N-terminal acetyltransferase A, auxiliary subunit [Trema orientale]